jgi:hypothetical protein
MFKKLLFSALAFTLLLGSCKEEETITANGTGANPEVGEYTLTAYGVMVDDKNTYLVDKETLKELTPEFNFELKADKTVSFYGEEGTYTYDASKKALVLTISNKKLNVEATFDAGKAILKWKSYKNGEVPEFELNVNKEFSEDNFNLALILNAAFGLTETQEESLEKGKTFRVYQEFKKK